MRGENGAEDCDRCGKFTCVCNLHPSDTPTPSPAELPCPICAYDMAKGIGHLCIKEEPAVCNNCDEPVSAHASWCGIGAEEPAESSEQASQQEREAQEYANRTVGYCANTPAWRAHFTHFLAGFDRAMEIVREGK